MATVVVIGRVADPATWTLVGCTAGDAVVARRDAPASLFWGIPMLGAVDAGATDRGLLFETTVKIG